MEILTFAADETVSSTEHHRHTLSLSCPVCKFVITQENSQVAGSTNGKKWLFIISWDRFTMCQLGNILKSYFNRFVI